ncbi:hypothetical protein OQA88_4365 [Cercophora sp. LCS_1]
MPYILRLPNEILSMIGESFLYDILSTDDDSKLHRESKRGLWALAKTSQRLYYIFSLMVYRWDAAERVPIALAWGALTGSTSIMFKAVAAKIDIETAFDVKHLRQFNSTHADRRDLCIFEGFDTEDASSLQPPGTGPRYEPQAGGRDTYRVPRKTKLVVTALHLAIVNNRVNAMEWLLERGAKKRHVKFPPWNPMGCAVSYGNLEAIQALVKYGSSLEACYEGWKSGQITALHIAVGRGHLHLIEFLMSENKLSGKLDILATRRSPGSGNFAMTPLRWAVNGRDGGAMIAKLAKHGAINVLQRGGELTPPPLKKAHFVGCPLIFAFSHGCFKDVAYLLKSSACGQFSHDDFKTVFGALVNTERTADLLAHLPVGRTALKTFMGTAPTIYLPFRQEITEYLFSSRKISINDVLYHGQTPLMMAVVSDLYRSAALVQYLYDVPGIDLTSRPSGLSGTTALHLAVREYMEVVVENGGKAHFFTPSEDVSREVLDILRVFMRPPPGYDSKKGKEILMVKNGRGKTIFDKMHEELHNILFREPPYDKTPKHVLFCRAKMVLDLMSLIVKDAKGHALSLAEAQSQEQLAKEWRDKFRDRYSKYAEIRGCANPLLKQDDVWKNGDIFQ